MVSFKQGRRLSSVVCCVCERQLSVQEVRECRSLGDESLRGEMYCRTCLEAEVPLCRECLCRRTADPQSVCGECMAAEYAMAG
jgi:hypothetical protein